MSGKVSKPRPTPVSNKVLEDNWERIFGNKNMFTECLKDKPCDECPNSKTDCILVEYDPKFALVD
jgi:hypothetical protein